jgi:hypothetical protein
MVARALLSIATFACMAPKLTNAQLYTFEDTPVPEARSLHTMYAFYVYSHQDAPDRSLGSPFVKFHSLEAHSTGEKADSELADYQSLQLSLLPYSDFWKLINPNKFCSSQADVDAGKAEHANQILVQKPEDGSPVHIYTQTVKFVQPGQPHSKDVETPVRRTGVYILVFSNCGAIFEAKVKGSVVVKNSYGFLPGNEYHKMPFYGWLSLAYVFLAVTWFGLSLRFWREIFHIQNCITGVIFLGLVESFLWWIFFNDWNSSGSRGQILFVLAILATVVKSIFSYMLVLVASLGWGVTRPYLDQKTIMKIQAISLLYIVLDFIRETVLSFRHSHTLSLLFVLLCLLPVSLLNGGIFYWIFTALSGLIETLKERRQTEKLVLFSRLWKLLVFSMGLASLTLLWQIFDLSRSITIRWHYQWLFADGVSHMLFLIVLLAMMFLWAPTSVSKMYAYSQPVDDEARDFSKKPKGDSSTVWEDDAAEDGEEDESFWATTHDTSKGAKRTVQKGDDSPVGVV